MSFQNLQGVLRPSAHLSSRIAFLFLLATAPAFCQQNTKQAPAATAPKTVQSITVEETNARIAQLAQASRVKQGDYFIGVGDVLTIDVFDVPELSREIRVNEGGYISLPLIPTKIRATGLTPYQLQDKLAELLQTNGLVSTPQVSINVKEQHSQPITVIGAVKAATVIQAVHSMTLLEALSQAGGVADDAGNNVIVTRAGSEAVAGTDPADPPDPRDPAQPDKIAPQTFTVLLSDLLNTGDPRFNIPLLGGDVVSVPRAGIIYVVGAVQKPGGFLLENDFDRMTMLKMLSLAGGATSTAKLKDAVILRKNLETGKRDQVPVDLKKVLKLKTQDIQLEANDILFVPDSESLKALHRAGDAALTLTTGIGIVAAGRL